MQEIVIASEDDDELASDAFSVFPVGQGWDIEVHEFDFRDNGGAVYEKNGVQGVPPFLARYTIDTHHTPGYAAGYLANEVQPRLFMTTHMPFDPYLNGEAVAEVREHWDGPFHFGAPDGIVVNVTKEQIWVREGILPDPLKDSMGAEWGRSKTEKPGNYALYRS